MANILTRLKSAKGKASPGSNSGASADANALAAHEWVDAGPENASKEKRRYALNIMQTSRAVASLRRGSKKLAADAKKKYTETARKAFIKAKAALKKTEGEGDAGVEGGPEFDPELFEPKFDFEVLGVRTRDVVLTEPADADAHRDEGRFGVTIAESHREADLGVHIVGISNTGSAAALGNVYVGDVILEVNGLLVLYTDPVEVEEMIRFATGHTLRLKLAASADLRACLQSEDSVEDQMAYVPETDLGDSASANIMACLSSLQTVPLAETEEQAATDALQPLQPRRIEEADDSEDSGTEPRRRTMDDFLSMPDEVDVQKSEVEVDIDSAGRVESHMSPPESKRSLLADEEIVPSSHGHSVDADNLDYLMTPVSVVEQLHAKDAALAQLQTEVQRLKLQEEADTARVARHESHDVAAENWRSEQARRAVAGKRLAAVRGELTGLADTQGRSRQETCENAVRESELVEEARRIESMLAAPPTCNQPPPISPAAISDMPTSPVPAAGHDLAQSNAPAIDTSPSTVAPETSEADTVSGADERPSSTTETDAAQHRLETAGTCPVVDAGIEDAATAMCHTAIALSGSHVQKDKMGTYKHNGGSHGSRPVFQKGKLLLYFSEKNWRVGLELGAKRCFLRNQSGVARPDATKVNWHETVRRGSDVMSANADIRATALSSTKPKVHGDNTATKKAQQVAAQRARKGAERFGKKATSAQPQSGHSKPLDVSCSAERVALQADETAKTSDGCDVPPRSKQLHNDTEQEEMAVEEGQTAEHEQDGEVPNTTIDSFDAAIAECSSPIAVEELAEAEYDGPEEETADTGEADSGEADTNEADLSTALSERKTKVWAWSVSPDNSDAEGAPGDGDHVDGNLVGSRDDCAATAQSSKAENTLAPPLISATDVMLLDAAPAPSGLGVSMHAEASKAVPSSLDDGSQTASQSAAEWLEVNGKLKTKLGYSCPFDGCNGCKDPLSCGFAGQYAASLLVSYLKSTDAGLIRPALINPNVDVHAQLVAEAETWKEHATRTVVGDRGPAVVHRVTSLDTLQGLAVKYGSTTTAIRKRNKMASSDVISYVTLEVPTSATSQVTHTWVPCPGPEALAVIIRVAIINHLASSIKIPFDEARVLLNLNNYDVSAAVAEHTAWSEAETHLAQPDQVEPQPVRQKDSSTGPSVWSQLSDRFNAHRSTQPSKPLDNETKAASQDSVDGDRPTPPAPLVRSVTVARRGDESGFGFQLRKAKDCDGQMVVSKVDPHGAADRAGVCRGDILSAVEGAPVVQDATLQDVVDAIRTACEGRKPPYVVMTCATPHKLVEAPTACLKTPITCLNTADAADLTAVELGIRDQIALLDQVHAKMTAQMSQATELGFGADEIGILQEEVARMAVNRAVLVARPLARLVTICRKHAPDGKDPGFRFERCASTDIAAEVVQVEEGGAADFAGLKTGDLLMEIDGSDVSQLEINTLSDKLQASGDEIVVGVAARPSPNPEVGADHEFKSVVSKSLTLAFDQLKGEAETTLGNWKQGWKQLTSEQSIDRTSTTGSGYDLIKESKDRKEQKISPEMIAASMKRVTLKSKTAGRDFGLRLSLTTSGQRLVEVLSVKTDSPFTGLPTDNEVMPGDVLIAVGKYTLCQEYANVAAALDLLECASVPSTVCFVSKALVACLPEDPVMLAWIVRQSAETSLRSHVQKWRTDLAVKVMQPPKITPIAVPSLDKSVAPPKEAAGSYVLGNRTCLICKSKPKNTILGCGHSFCEGCCARMHICPVKLCQRIIMNRTPMSHRHRSSLEEKACMGNGLMAQTKGAQMTPLPVSMTTMSPLGQVELSDDACSSPVTGTPMKDSGKGLIAGNWQVAKTLDFVQDEPVSRKKSPKKRSGIKKKQRHARLIDDITTSHSLITPTTIQPDTDSLEEEDFGDTEIYAL